jgi:hypothetical protein
METDVHFSRIDPEYDWMWTERNGAEGRTDSDRRYKRGRKHAGNTTEGRINSVCRARAGKPVTEGNQNLFCK